MLPPGHVAAGYLTAKALLHFSHFQFSSSQQNQLLLWGMLFSFIPDLDTFYAFAKEKALAVREPERNNHRNYFSHAPVLWFIAGILIYFFAQTNYVKFIGLLLWLASWSHFLLDSIEHGIMWLWPLSKKRFALKDIERNSITEQGFFGFWLKVIKIYTTRLTFYLEILIIVIAITIFFQH